MSVASSKKLIDGVAIDKFNGVTPEELYSRTLPDRIDYNLDIVFVNLCPNLHSVFAGNHYAGPGNHFWRCLHGSGLTKKRLKPTEDFSLAEFKIGSVHMLRSPIGSSKGAQDLSFFEINQAQENLMETISEYKPKIIAFNGKSVFDVYTGKVAGRDFNFGKQPNKFDNDKTDIYIYVLPSSEARSANYQILPKYTDKLPFYSGLKKLKEFLNGTLSHPLNDLTIIFPKFQVVLEKEQASGDDESSSIDENNQSFNLNTSKSGQRTKKIYRLNNLPYSDLPASMLESLESQRILKKEVIIPSTSMLYQGYLVKKSLNDSLDTSITNKLHAVCSESDINEGKKTHLVCDQGSNGATSLTSTCGSDESTNESMFAQFAVTKNESVDRNLKSENIDASESAPKPLKQLQPKPAILNLSSTGNVTLKKILSAPLSHNNPAIRNINITTQSGSNKKVFIANNGQALKPQTYKIVQFNKTQKINQIITPKVNNSQTLNEPQLNNQISQKDQNTVIVANANIKHLKIKAKPSANTTNMTENKSDKHINNTNDLISNQSQLSSASNQNKNNPIVPETNVSHNNGIVMQLDPYEPSANVPYMTYEMLIEDRYRPSDYYSFNDNPIQYNDDEKMNIMNRFVNLHYTVKKENKLPIYKRHFSSLSEADHVILNSRETKRECRIDFFNM